MHAASILTARDLERPDFLKQMAGFLDQKRKARAAA